ncbi:39S ribosomal protein L17, mitochondrial [Hylaeus volcanicus]|uniref:39S ribosomal protein L17, mitochondrial n=1 Tax=Hylaeus volcanicus TaxID=313075 RepID=UPI0023B88452|nr:39S ribosomal protein L17, mitochondrial [Hylaeus volcanicus]
MNQAKIEKLIPRIRYKITPEARKLRNLDGPEGRITKIKKTLTALIKYERIELNYNRADETRGYVERLISEALQHGPEHKETMKLADFWILEKQYIHKLFKVLVPRYQDHTSAYTKLHRAPGIYPGYGYIRVVLELQGNMYPKVEQYDIFQHNLIHNVLLDAARKEFRIEKYKEISESMKLS